MRRLGLAVAAALVLGACGGASKPASHASGGSSTASSASSSEPVTDAQVEKCLIGALASGTPCSDGSQTLVASGLSATCANQQGNEYECQVQAIGAAPASMSGTYQVTDDGTTFGYKQQ